MRRTTSGDLVAPFFAVGVLMYLLLRLTYGSLPTLQIFVPVPVLVLAVAELVMARRVRAAVDHHPGARPMAAVAIARAAALGKASSLVAAALLGAAVALLVRVAPEAARAAAARHDTVVGALLLLASGLLLVAGVLLERASVDPARR